MIEIGQTKITRNGPRVYAVRVQHANGWSSPRYSASRKGAEDLAARMRRVWASEHTRLAARSAAAYAELIKIREARES